MKKLLIVDDDPMVRQVLVEMLKNDGHAISTAADGADALEMVHREKFDLVISDVWMPRLNGLELLSELHGMAEAPAVIIMTADDTPETMLRVIKEQANHYVNKPFKAAEIHELVYAALAASPPPPVELISGKPDWVELLVPCDLRYSDHIHTIMMKLKGGLPQEVRESLSQAFRELLNNAIEWGGKLDKSRKVRISYVRGKRMIIYRISDPGEGFHFEGLEHAAINNPPDDPISHMRIREERGMRPGGLGILMTRALVDELIYNEAHNEVVFIKYLD